MELGLEDSPQSSVDPSPLTNIINHRPRLYSVRTVLQFGGFPRGKRRTEEEDSHPRGQSYFFYYFQAREDVFLVVPVISSPYSEVS